MYYQKTKIKAAVPSSAAAPKSEIESLWQEFASGKRTLNLRKSKPVPEQAASL